MDSKDSGALEPLPSQAGLHPFGVDRRLAKDRGRERFSALVVLTVIPHFPREIDLRSVLPRGLQIWSLKMAVQRLLIVFTMLASCASAGPTSAQTPNPELEACRSTGLMALRERNPAIKDISFDVDGMTVAKANTKVEDTPIKTIVIGDAYLEKGKQDTRRTFLCLIGEKGKVLLTFFTDK